MLNIDTGFRHWKCGFYELLF